MAHETDRERSRGGLARAVDLASVVRLGARASRLKLALAGGGAFLLLLLVIGIFAGSASPTCAPPGGGQGVLASLGAGAANEHARRDIPRRYLAIYQATERDYGIAWEVLAGIGKRETDHGRLALPGVDSGVNSHGCCAGPMQFYISPYPGILDANETNPSTWGAYGIDADRDGEKNVYDPSDAIPAAARYLNALGARGDIRAAIFGYNHAWWYVDEVLAFARAYGWDGGPMPGGADGAETALASLDETSDAACPQPALAAGGEPVLTETQRLFEPRRFVRVPARYTGGALETVDARVLDDLVWAMDEYRMVLTQGRGGGASSPSNSHGWGTAADLVPAPGVAWERSTEAFARDLGWEPACGDNGLNAAIGGECERMVPAIRFVGYNGYDGHGDPTRCAGGCAAHLHVSWECDCGGGIYDGELMGPSTWVAVFARRPGAPLAGEETEPGRDRVLVIGDSLGLGTAPHLERRLGAAVTIDARVGRSSPEGIEVLRERIGPRDGVVVFDLGSNDAAAAVLEDALRAAARVAAGRCLVVATINRRAGAGEHNRVIRELAANPGVELVDWHEITARHPQLLADGVHPTPSGYERRAEAIMNGIDSCTRAGTPA